MALTDTYNTNLTRFRLYCPAENSAHTATATDWQEAAYAYCNIEIAKMGQTVPLTGAAIVNALKMAEAMIAVWYFIEATIQPDDDKEFGVKSQIRKNGEEMLREWLDVTYGSEGENADSFVSHVKQSRPVHIAASKFDDDRDVL